jgi:hypothetical protein
MSAAVAALQRSGLRPELSALRPLRFVILFAGLKVRVVGAGTRGGQEGPRCSGGWRVLSRTYPSVIPTLVPLVDRIYGCPSNLARPAAPTLLHAPCYARLP